VSLFGCKSRDHATHADKRLVSSNGDLESEVDDDKIVTDEDKSEAAALKAKANKAFAGGLQSLAQRTTLTWRRKGVQALHPTVYRRHRSQSQRLDFLEQSGHGQSKDGGTRWSHLRCQ
jgi:hypothetical protein